MPDEAPDGQASEAAGSVGTGASEDDGFAAALDAAAIEETDVDDAVEDVMGEDTEEEGESEEADAELPSGHGGSVCEDDVASENGSFKDAMPDRVERLESLAHGGDMLDDEIFLQVCKEVADEDETQSWINDAPYWINDAGGKMRMRMRTKSCNMRKARGNGQ